MRPTATITSHTAATVFALPHRPQYAILRRIQKNLHNGILPLSAAEATGIEPGRALEEVVEL
jgi:hypothetical protein